MNGREIVSNEENGGRGASREALRLDLCIEQLHSPSLMRLWRTGCAELLHTAKEDEDLDVIFYLNLSVIGVVNNASFNYSQHI